MAINIRENVDIRSRIEIKIDNQQKTIKLCQLALTTQHFIIKNLIYSAINAIFKLLMILVRSHRTSLGYR